MWCDENLEGKKKLRYYKEVINPNIEDKNDLFVLTRVEKKIHIDKIRTNIHELHSEARRWNFSKTSMDERICHLCETMSVEDEKVFLLDSAYTHVRSRFQNFCYSTDILNLQSHKKI